MTHRSTTPPNPLLDRFLADDLEGDALHRGRLIVGFSLLVLAGYGAALVPFGWLGWTVAFAISGAMAALTFGVLEALRRQRLQPLGAARVVLPGSAVALLAIAATDMGLAAPELVWMSVLPFIAALAGGRRLALVCALITALGAVGLAIAGVLTPFDQTAPATVVNLVAVVSLVGVALTGAVFGQFYDDSIAAQLDAQRRSLGRLTDALRQSEARYRSALENVPVGVVQTTADGRFVLANRAMAHLLGYETTKEMIADGRTAGDYYAEHALRDALLADLLKTGALHRYETVWKDRHGRPLHVRIDAHARYGSAGSLVGVEGTVEDVTAEVEARQGLLQSEARFRALVQRSSDVVVVVNRQGLIAYVSPSIETLTGYEPESLIGQPVFSFLHPDDAAPGESLFHATQASPSPIPATEFRLRHRDGHFLFAEGVGTPLFDDPAIEGLVINFRDVTDRKRAEAVLVHTKDQAEEIARMKSTFLANMSHEIRTPLTGILGFTEILADEVTDPQQKEFVDLIGQSGRRLMETLNSVLDLAKLDAGRMDLAAEPVSLAGAAREATQLLSPLAKDKGLVLEAEVTDETARADLDRGALGRIVTNLVGNAIKFTEEGGVRIRVRGNDAQVALDVIDTGIGIGEEFLPRLFDEFQQESDGAGRLHEGSGLGLAITRQLTERMEGHITVESERDVGTTFTVVFPRSLEREASGEASAPEADAGERTPRVLVVDDNPQTLRMAERMIESVYRVTTAGTARDAETLATRAAEKGDPYDVLLLDINLGTVDTGEDVMRRLRLHAPYGDRPIVAFTAYALPGDRERFLANGFDGYFAKPFTRETMLSVLADAIGEAPPSAVPPPPARFIVRNEALAASRASGGKAPGVRPPGGKPPAPAEDARPPAYKAPLPRPTSVAEQLLQAGHGGPEA